MRVAKVVLQNERVLLSIHSIMMMMRRRMIIMVITTYHDDGYAGENNGKITQWAATAKNISLDISIEIQLETFFGHPAF